MNILDLKATTTLDIKPMLNLIPSVLPEDRGQCNKIVHEARKICWDTLLAWEVENGSMYPKMLSHYSTQWLDGLVFSAYRIPNKWNDYVRIRFGEPNTKQFDWCNKMLCLISFYDDIYFDEAQDVLDSGKYDAYRQWRGTNRDATHSDAMEYIATAHFHNFVPKESGSSNKILGTWDITTTYTCECGQSYETRSYNNYSGD